MNGAESLIRTLVDNGVDTCFTNPGTSEMHFVAALDQVPEMRAVLALFEGVATGAADGYARMTDKPAATLLHLGSGLGNGLANLHNARKGKVPVINIVGDHATYHVQYDALLQSDIETVARNVSPWVWTSQSTEELGADAAEAIEVASGPPGQVATLILPADVSWGDGGAVGPVVSRWQGAMADDATLDAVVAALGRGRRTAIMLGSRGLREDAMALAAQITATTGARLLGETFPTRMERGAGLPVIERLAYLAELASVQLDGLENLILVDADAPVSFFAYPGKKSYLVPDGCQVHTLAGADGDVLGSLEAVAARVPGKARPVEIQEPSRPKRPRGKLTADDHRRRTPPRLAHPHRWRYRTRATRGARCGRRMPGSAGSRAAGGRLGDVHDSGVVDDGPRTTRRHSADPEPRFRCSRRRVWGCRRCASRMPRHWSTNYSVPSPNLGRI